MKCPPGYTNIVNARQEFDQNFHGALRSLGFRATIQRRRVWIDGDEAHYFDLALEKSLMRFRRFKQDVLARAATMQEGRP